MKKFIKVAVVGFGLSLGISAGPAISGPPCSVCEELLEDCERTDDIRLCRAAFNCFRWCSGPIR